MNKIIYIIILLLSILKSQTFSIARIHYSGGGDWYSNPSSLPNLLKYLESKTPISVNQNEYRVKLIDENANQFPFLYMTGHGNVLFNKTEIDNLRRYLTGGGFLHIDDNYGMDQYIRTEMKKVFPELNFVELPHDHDIYNNVYPFENGLPKIHEHDNKPPQGLALIYHDKIICFYSYESDLGDGWEDPNIHRDPEYVRMKALKMGANILCYAMNQTQ